MTNSLLRKRTDISSKQQVITETINTKIDIFGEEKRLNSNNNEMSDGINGYTNPCLKDIGLKCYQINKIDSNLKHK